MDAGAGGWGRGRLNVRPVVTRGGTQTGTLEPFPSVSEGADVPVCPRPRQVGTFALPARTVSSSSYSTVWSAPARFGISASAIRLTTAQPTR